MSENDKPFSILIVDDTTKNIQIVAQVLKGLNYQMAFAVSGKEALEQIYSNNFDLILLDIMMPEMDGYEVCRILKSSEDYKDIPIIFLSAKSDTEDIVKGFDLGAVDYLTKPFKPAELLARVRTHLSLKAAREKIEEQKIKLEIQNEELMEMARLRDDIERITHHDLKNPLNAIIQFPDLIKSIGPLTEKQELLLKNIEVSGFQMLNMINSSLDLVKMERGSYEFHPIDLNVLDVIRKVKSELLKQINRKKIDFLVLVNNRTPAEGDTFKIFAEELLSYSMFTNLIKNAVEASSENDVLSIELENRNHKSIIKIHNRGVVPEAIRNHFFDKYITHGKGNYGTGLGTYSAKLMANTQNAEIDMTTSEEGTTITLVFPS